MTNPRIELEHPLYNALVRRWRAAGNPGELNVAGQRYRAIRDNDRLVFIKIGEENPNLGSYSQSSFEGR